MQPNSESVQLDIHFEAYGRHLAIAGEAYINHISRLMQPYGLDRFHFALLHICENSGEITQKQLCELTQRDKVAINRAVDFLCERGFVERQSCTEDRRCQMIAATEVGFIIAPIIRSAIDKTNQLFFKNLSESEWISFKTSLAKILAISNNMPAPEFFVITEKQPINGI